MRLAPAAGEVAPSPVRVRINSAGVAKPTPAQRLRVLRDYELLTANQAGVGKTPQLAPGRAHPHPRIHSTVRAPTPIRVRTPTSLIVKSI
jgi:hypothetical protein